MFDSKDLYVQYLRSKSDQLFHVKPYIGNSGDTLIRMGTEELLRELRIATTINSADADIILWPGGNPSMWPSNGWAETLGRFPGKSLVVGPATFQSSEYDWVSNLNKAKCNIDAVFARDTISFKNLQEAGLNNRTCLGMGHDPALHLRGSTWANNYCDASTDEYLLAAFRKDHEASFQKNTPSQRLINSLPNFARRRISIARANAKISQRINQIKIMSKSDIPLRVNDVSSLDFFSFVEWVNRAKEVHTDRLHCLLLAVILGKTVFGYRTSYQKLESVYDHSLKSWAKVEFVND